MEFFNPQKKCFKPKTVFETKSLPCFPFCDLSHLSIAGNADDVGNTANGGHDGNYCNVGNTANDGNEGNKCDFRFRWWISPVITPPDAITSNTIGSET